MAEWDCDHRRWVWLSLDGGHREELVAPVFSARAPSKPEPPAGNKSPRRGFSRDLYVENRLRIVCVQSNIHTTFSKQLCQQSSGTIYRTRARSEVPPLGNKFAEASAPSRGVRTGRRGSCDSPSRAGLSGHCARCSEKPGLVPWVRSFSHCFPERPQVGDRGSKGMPSQEGVDREAEAWEPRPHEQSQGDAGRGGRGAAGSVRARPELGQR